MGLLKELEGKNYQIDDQLARLVIATESETRTLRAATCILTITNLLLEAWREGIKPLSLTWFWLETSTFDAGDSHTFFVVDQARDRIVCEEMGITEGPEERSKFDRAVFEPENESRSSGLEAYWYGRFYQETKLGKLLSLASGWRRPKVLYRHDSRSDWDDSATGKGLANDRTRPVDRMPFATAANPKRRPFSLQDFGTVDFRVFFLWISCN
jgi:hypothetical protein